MTTSNLPSACAQATLKALQEAVTKELEKKRRLGHYAVFWKDGRVKLMGEDAPTLSSEPHDK